MEWKIEVHLENSIEFGTLYSAEDFEDALAKSKAREDVVKINTSTPEVASPDGAFTGKWQMTLVRDKKGNWVNG